MKKLKMLIFLPLAFAILFLSACASATDSTPQSNNYYDDDGNFVIESTGNKTVMIDEIPYSVPYNGKVITLESVEFYENCPNYSYNLFTVITLDVSNLSEAEIHWIRESDLSVKAYITSEANDYDFSSGVALGSILFTDTNKLIFVQTSSFFKENRHSFGNSDISVSVVAKQEETYQYTNAEGKTSNLHKTEEITYRTTISKTIPDAEEIEMPLYDYVVKWLNSKADFFS